MGKHRAQADVGEHDVPRQERARGAQLDGADPNHDGRRAVDYDVVRDRVHGQAHEQPRWAQVIVLLVAIAVVLADAEERAEPIGPQVPAAATLTSLLECELVRRSASIHVLAARLQRRHGCVLQQH